MITDEELRELLGSDADEIKYIVEHLKRGRKYIKDSVDKEIL